MTEQDFEKAHEREFVTIRHSPAKKMIWNEWRGNTPSAPLREAMLFACEFIIANGVELILADYSKMQPPSLQDQNWIAIRSAEILQHSQLKRVGNIMGADIFQQMSIETIYEIASKYPLPCESRNFISKDDALEWLLSAD